MWIYVATSFTRYRKAGVEARKAFEVAMGNDGFHHLHPNLFVRYCSTASNASMHRERVKRMIPPEGCDVSIILSPDGQEQNVYHSLGRRHRRPVTYGKPSPVEFL